MTTQGLLRELDARGIRVVLQGDRVSLRGPGDVLTAELTEHLRQHKPEILEAARRCPKCAECDAVICPRIRMLVGARPRASRLRQDGLATGGDAGRCGYRGSALMAHAETGARRRSAPANIDEAVHLAPASLRRPPAVTINETNGF